MHRVSIQRYAVAAAFTLAALSGCSSIALDPSGGKPVPPDRIYQDALVGAPRADQATALFLRDWGFGGGGCEHDILIDGTKAFTIAVNERIEINLAPGHHLIRIQDATFLCVGTTTSTETILAAGEHARFRIQLTGTGTVNLARVE